MARIAEGLHSFICTLTRLFTNESYLAFAFPAEAGPHLPTLKGWKAELTWVTPRQVNILPIRDGYYSC